jgi:hypothetical protein
VNVVEHEDEECREGTKLCSECYEPNGEGEYEDDDDDGQAYVVRQLLLTPKADDETQQHKLFHARCITNSFLTLLSIRGSCENINGRATTVKSGLNIEKHYEPYNICWIKKVTKITVMKRCNVFFFPISKYKDKVYHDIVDIL